MSLINDYLKKNRGPGAEKSADSGSVPPVLQRAAAAGGAAGSESESKRPLSAKTVVLLIVMLLVGAAAYFMTMPESADYGSSPAVEQPLPEAALPQAEVEPVAQPRRPPVAARVSPVAAEGVAGFKKELPKREPETGLKPEAGIPESPAVATTTPTSENSAAGGAAPAVVTVAPAFAPETAAGRSEPDSISEPGSMNLSSRPLEGAPAAREERLARTPKADSRENIDHLFQIGVLALNRGNLSRAAYYFDRVSELNPQHLDSLLNLAVISIKQGALAQARTYLDRAEKVEPTDARIAVNRGLIAIKTGDKSRARKLFSAALRLDPGAKSALNNLIWLALQDGDRAAAARYYQNLAAIDGGNVRLLLAYASFCEEEQNFKQALVLYNEALELDSLQSNRVLKRRVRQRIRVLADFIK